MEQSIRTVLIMGGGTAGWMTALFLSRALNRGNRDSVRISLVESSNITTIGVGEATIPSLRGTMAGMGLVEDEWMARCNASFKLAIKFVGWSGRPGDDVFWHPFADDIPLVEGQPVWHAWVKRRFGGDTEEMADACFVNVAACRQGRAPKQNGDTPYQGALSYAYHFDAGLVAAYMKDKARIDGVAHIIDDVVDVALDERGYVKHLVTKNHGALVADLYIDCSGFRGRLINGALGEPFISYSDYLFCDRAVAMRVPYLEGEEIEPYTTAAAMPSGWMWNIPLQNRRGVGYVYSSASCSPSEAEQELSRKLGKVAGGVEPWHISMRIGRNRNAWVNNCVSIGLAGGFLEPLESTGIFLIEVALRELWNNFPDKSFDPRLRERFNRLIAGYYDHIRDFIVLHYCLTEREDTPFWRANKNHSNIPDSLRANLAMWRTALPDAVDISEPRVFRPYSYASIVAGMGFLPERVLPVMRYADDATMERTFNEIRRQVTAVSEELPEVRSYLRRLQVRNAGTRMGP